MFHWCWKGGRRESFGVLHWKVDGPIVHFPEILNRVIRETWNLWERRRESLSLCHFVSAGLSLSLFYSSSCFSLTWHHSHLTLPALEACSSSTPTLPILVMLAVGPPWIPSTTCLATHTHTLTQTHMQSHRNAHTQTSRHKAIHAHTQTYTQTHTHTTTPSVTITFTSY